MHDSRYLQAIVNFNRNKLRKLGHDVLPNSISLKEDYEAPVHSKSSNMHFRFDCMLKILSRKDSNYAVK